MNINIPPDSRRWLFGNPGDADGAKWSFRYPPPCAVGDPLHFRFDGVLVARAVVYAIYPPGVHDGFAHHGRRFLTGHKVVWLWSTFEDLRDRPGLVAWIEQQLNSTRRRRRREANSGPSLFRR